VVDYYLFVCFGLTRFTLFMFFNRFSKASIEEPKPQGSLRKALSASLDSLSKAVKSLDFKKRTNTTQQKGATKKAPRKANEEANRVDIDSINPKEMPSLKQKKGFALQAGEEALDKLKGGLLKFKPPSETTLHPEPQEMMIPSLNTPTTDAAEEELRNRLLRDLIHGRTILSPLFTEHYVLGDLLGDGAFGFVFSAKRKQVDTEVAVKFIIRSKIPAYNWKVLENGDKVPQEIAVLSTLEHPNIVKYLGYVLEKDFVLLITELHGTSWDPSNPALDKHKNPGLKFQYKPVPQQPGIRSRTSCDLFECIDARKFQITRPTYSDSYCQNTLCANFDRLRILGTTWTGSS
jgi:hypothetical protein